MEKSLKQYQKELDREALYNEQYLKAKIKSFNGKVNTNFHYNKIPKKDSKFIYLSVILIDSVCRACKNYYPQVFVEECKYFVKEKKMPEYITDNIEISSDDFDREDSNEENPVEENADEKNCDEEN